MIRLLFYILIFYLIYKFIKYVLQKANRIHHKQEEYYVYDEYGNLRKEKDITHQVKILEEKNIKDE